MTTDSCSGKKTVELRKWSEKDGILDELLYQYIPKESIGLGNWIHDQYAMHIDLDSVYDNGTDYVYVIAKSNNGSSNSYLFRESPSRIRDQPDLKLISHPRLTKYFGEGLLGSGFVNFRLDLNQLNLPKSYKLLFASSNMYELPERNSECNLSDIVDPVVVPPPEIKMTTVPSSLTIQTHQTGNIRIIVNSSTDLDSEVRFIAPHIPELELEFIPPIVSVSPNGIADSSLQIKSLADNESNKILPIFGRVNFISKISPFTSSEMQSSQNITGVNIHAYPQVAVILPKTYYEQLLDITNTLDQITKSIQALIAAISAIGAAIFGVWIKLGRRTAKSPSNSTKRSPI